jgi:hypothetical protein
MQAGIAEISVRGKWVQVPSVHIRGRQIVVTGTWLKVAAIRDAEWLENVVIEDVESCIAELKESLCAPDIFTFSQAVSETRPKHPYRLEWDNAAAVPITTYADWWENRITQVSRKNVRRSQKRGLVVRVVPFDDKLVRGIMGIYNETPTRQGRRFWHYGKDFDSVKRENSSYLDRSEFVAAYYQDELIGFIKIVFVGRVARIMQILSLNQHFDKRPTNALIAKAVEVCCDKGASHFIYGKYVYDNKANSSVTEFKRRNGFEQVMIPTYFVPLTVKGRVALALRVHRGIRKMIPEKVANVLLDARAKIYSLRDIGVDASPKSEGSGNGKNTED